jgi:pimeloyl-ACP methyl ester carboxylesterase
MMPVTALSGLQDRVFYDADDVAELVARLPDAQRIDLPEVGHLIPIERPQAVVDAGLALVERLV